MRLSLLWNDLALAVRKARTSPAFTLLVVATLALGLGTAAAVFAIADAALLRPLPYRDPDRLVFLWETLPQQNVFEVEATPADYVDFQRLTSFEGLALVADENHTIVTGAEAERIRGARVTASTIPLLGIAPALGRSFTPPEDDSSAAPVAILGDGLWRRRYGADPGIVGRTIDVDGTLHTVVGVMPASAVLPGPLGAAGELWLPMRMTPDERAKATSHNYTAIGRLAAGVALARAASEVTAFSAALAEEKPAHRGLGARLVPVGEDTVAHIRPALTALLGGVLLLLVIASANVSTLLLSRAVVRGHDAAVRAALGASRARMFWETAAEATVLTLAGAAAGLALATALVRAFVPLFAAALPRTAHTIEIGVRTASAILAVAVVLALAFAALTMRRSSDDAALADTLRAGRRSSASPRAARARTALVVAQVALAVVLLAGAGVMLRSIVRLSHVNPGFVPDRVLTFRLALDGSSYVDPKKRAAFAAALTGALTAAPGVSGAALISRLPLGGSRGADGVEIEGRPRGAGEMIIIDQRDVTPDYFRTMSIPMLRGRALSASDTDRTEQVTVINRTMAARYFGSADPVNRRVRITGGADGGQWIRIVGVVDDVHHVSLTRPPVAEMYRPFAQTPDTEFAVVVKTQGEPSAAAGAARSAVQALDPNVPIFDLRTMPDRVAGSFAELRATMLLLGFTALLAAILAAVAIYGAIWYSVSQRTNEIGLRLALGAGYRSLCAGIVGRALAMTAAGAAIGVAAAIAVAPMLAGLLFETSGADPATIAIVVGGLFAITLAAAAGPARRAIRVDPMTALRSE